MNSFSISDLKEHQPSYWLNFIIAAALYISLAIGSFGFAEFDWLRVLPMSAAALTGLFAITWTRSVTSFDVLILISLAVILLLQFARTNHADLALAKLDGAVAGSVVTFCLARSGYVGWGDKSLLAFVHVALGVLLLTIVYKAALGFSDRSVRFFINGPIVFAWLMGIALLLSLYLHLQELALHRLLLPAVFLLAVVWSESKGPLIAVAICICYMLSRPKHVWRVALIAILATVLSLVAVDADIVPERFKTFQRVVQGELTDADFGSVGLRRLMWDASYAMFTDHPVTGVGLANWSDHTPAFKLGDAPVTYPHNIALEMLSEHGLVGASALIALFLLLFAYSGKPARVLVVFSVISLCFSGDAAYWNFIVGLCLGWRKV